MKLILGTFAIASAVLSALASNSVRPRVDVDSHLVRFGYIELAPNEQMDAAGRREAIRVYQRNMGLRVTGTVNRETLREMGKPRCGMKDDPARFSAPGPAWRSRTLSYKFENYSPDLPRDSQRRAVYNGFKYWSDVANINFRETTSSNADIKILFAEGNHGDGVRSAFDGQGGVLAHAFFPEDGRVHYDDAERYTERRSDGINLETVSAHEFGHTLGISHSYTRGALMFPSYQGYDPNLQLHQDDINAVRSLYGARIRPPTTRRTTTTTTTSTTTRRTTPPVQPDHCGVSGFTAFATGHDYTYAFKGSYVYLLSDSGVRQRKLIQFQFRGGPRHVNAAAYNKRTRRYFLFSNDQMYTFSTSFRRISSGQAPRRLPQYIDSVFQWGDGRLIAFKGSRFYMMDRFGRAAYGPYTISRYFRGVPRNLDSSTVWKDGYLYFFKGSRYYKMNPNTRTMIRGYPKTTSAAWLGCGPRVERFMVEDPEEPFTADDSISLPLGIADGLRVRPARRHQG